MMHETTPESMQQSTVAAPLTTTGESLRHLTGQAGIAIAATALVALCAHISVPLGFTPVPITLQPFAVLLLGLLLSPAMSFAALALYLLEGAAGLPVFSPHGPGGLFQLFGYSGGYLMAGPFAAALAGLLYRRAQRSWAGALAGAALGDLLLLTGGAAWFGILTHTGAATLLRVSIAPFLVSDAAKVLAAAACAKIFFSFTQRAQPTSPSTRS